MTVGERRTIDASVHPCLWVLSLPLVHCGFCPYKILLVLDDDEARKHETSLCGWSETQRPYGEMGSVEKTSCCCLVCVDSSDFGTIVPGSGCDHDLADDIVHELQCRLRTRGDPAHLQSQEAALRRIKIIESKLDRIVEHLASAPNAKFMEERISTQGVMTDSDDGDGQEETALIGSIDYEPHNLYHMETF